MMPWGMLASDTVVSQQEHRGLPAQTVSALVRSLEHEGFGGQGRGAKGTRWSADRSYRAQSGGRVLHRG